MFANRSRKNIGHSIGANLLLNFEVLHQHRFKNLILLDGEYFKIPLVYNQEKGMGKCKLY